MGKHAILSPSGSVKWLNCAGAPAMEAGFPDDGNAYSKEGTAAHALAAMALEEGKDCAAYIGRRVDVGPHETVEITASMAEDVQVYVDNVRGRVAMYEAAGADVVLLVEQEVPIGHITGEEGATGTADVIILATWPDGRSLLDLSDLKFGRGMAVDAERNPQLMHYALGALEIVAPLGYEPTEFVLVIHQPRIKTAPSEWGCSIEALQEFAVYARGQAASCHAVLALPTALGSTLTPGPHCDKGFCKARATCPALARYVEEQVGADFENLDRTDLEVGNKGDAELSAKMSAIDLIESWCKAVRAEVERRLLAGTPVPGYKLVRGRAGARAWSDETEAEKLMKSFRLKSDEMYSYKLISPTQAEKLLKAQPKRWSKVEALITRSEGKPSVAPESDKRPALVVESVLDGFEEVKS